MTALQERAIELLRNAGVLPVVTVNSADQGVAIARALAEGGLSAIEVTLRSDTALAAIEAIKREVPSIDVGAGTVLSPAQIVEARQAGCDFLVTPGTPPALAEALAECPLPCVPGAATPAELMALMALGFRAAKLFPAAAVGGLAMIRGLRGPLPALKLCPTGGIGEADAAAYLREPNVVCVGGSWLTPEAALAARDYTAVAAAAARARALLDAES